ncbi:helix-turn-helix domain-containing protein [Nocardia iowensis]|uniref:Helix-turn-helix domain-containing protein n=1 Tax=Nocardia iowensis TaxID=204891 RepID=A0ABX8RUD7_NOCIO|nr:helix-turn-helix domain-containing protein [Nocardia iowensis]
MGYRSRSRHLERGQPADRPGPRAAPRDRRRPRRERPLERRHPARLPHRRAHRHRSRHRHPHGPGPLATPAQRHLLQGLAAYLAAASANTAAEHLHPQTLRYRLRRAVELTGRDPAIPGNASPSTLPAPSPPPSAATPVRTAGRARDPCGRSDHASSDFISPRHRLMKLLAVWRG